MLLWIISAALSLIVVVIWSVGEWRHEVVTGGQPPPGSPLGHVVAKTCLFVVLMVAVHGVIDPDHDQHTIQLHAALISRAVYGFMVTTAMLLAFPTLRIGAGAGLMVLAIAGLEFFQWLGLLPGIFRPIDGLSAVAGVCAAAGPMLIGAYRARRNVSWEQAEAARRSSKPISD